METFQIPTATEVAEMEVKEVKKSLDGVLEALYQKLGWERYRRLVVPAAGMVRDIGQFLIWASQKLAEIMTMGQIIPFPKP